MKRNHALQIAFMLIALSGRGQDYRPLWAGMHRAFAEPAGPSRMYSLALDSMQVAGSDTLLFNFFVVNDSVSHYAGCGYLGGDECYRRNKPSWAGRGIKPIANDHFQFHNTFNGTLDFQLPTATTDTGWFYSDSEQRFGLTFALTDTASILGVLDSARFYHVVHVDPLGGIISSPLNAAPFTICRSLGLVEFFQVDSFPTVLRRLRMIGDAQQQIGLHCITDASIHDYEVGDEVQYWHFEYSIFPETISGYHSKRTVLSRSETATTVSYSVQVEFFVDGSTQSNTSMATPIFYKTDTLVRFPFESFEGTVRTMYRMDHCGVLLWHYDYDPDNLWDPCPWGPCWSPWVNGKGPNPESSAYHILGLGSGYSFSQYFLPQPWGGVQYMHDFTGMPYFKKNGIPCGQEMIANVPEQSDRPAMTVVPNPTDGLVTITTEKPMAAIRIHDALGRSVYSGSATANRRTVDLGELPPGTYHMQVEYADGMRESKRLLVVRR